jgi:EAL domain-containing protein (putative c-di-GMP-specific phosphodiesterase class I)
LQHRRSDRQVGLRLLQRGVLLPADFIPLAEARGLIGAIDTFVLDEACRQLAQWTSEGGYPESFTVSVNLSGQQLSDPTLVARVASSIKSHGVVPSQLCLEITEIALIGQAPSRLPAHALAMELI